jgi:hypothetical protein
MRIRRLTLSFVITLLVAASLSAQNAVVQWNAIASTTIITNAKEASVTSGVWLAYVHLAVFDAVNAITIASSRTCLPPILQPGRIRMLLPSRLPTGFWLLTSRPNSRLWTHSSRLRSPPSPTLQPTSRRYYGGEECGTSPD